MWRSLVIVVGGQVLLLGCMFAMIAVRLAHLGGGRRICQERIAAWAGDRLLDMLGVDVVLHQSAPWPSGPCFYMSNHSSALDMPILMSLRLPNARTFIKERFRWYGSLGAVLSLTGSLYTAPQEQHERRVKRFREAQELLARTGESVFGSPEGTRVEGGRVGPFNRGVFHIVTELQMPIVPLLIRIPDSLNAGEGVRVGAGTAHVHVGQPIDTSAWTLEDLDTNKDQVRELFLAWQDELSS